MVDFFNHSGRDFGSAIIQGRLARGQREQQIQQQQQFEQQRQTQQQRQGLLQQVFTQAPGAQGLPIDAAEGTLTRATQPSQQQALGQLFTVDPQTAAQTQAFLQNLNEQQRTEALRENQVLTRTALDALSLPVDQRRPFLEQKRQEFVNQGRDVSNITGALQQDDAGLDQLINLQAREGLNIEQLAAQQITQPREVAAEQRIFERGVGEEQRRFEREQPIKQLEESVKQEKTKFDQALKIRAELQKRPQIQDFNKVESAFGRIQVSAEDPSGSGDLALVFNFMKMLDPGSVVRESEFRTAEQARAWLASATEEGFKIPSFVASKIQRATTGGFLTIPQRKDFVNRAQKLFDKQLKLTERVEKDFIAFGKRIGLEKEDIIVRGQRPTVEDRGQELREAGLSDEAIVEKLIQEGFGEQIQ